MRELDLRPSLFKLEELADEAAIIEHQVDLLEKAKKEVILCYPEEEIADPRIIQALIQAARRDVKIRPYLLGKTEGLILEQIPGVERYRVVEIPRTQTHFMVVDRESVIVEKPHLPREERTAYLKTDTYFIGEWLRNQFVILANKAEKF